MNALTATAADSYLLRHTHHLASPRLMDAVRRRHLLSELSAFTAYRQELARWLDSPLPDDAPLYRAGMLLCDAARAAGVWPEQILIALHESGLRPQWLGAGEKEQRARDQRYTRAVQLLMQCCFGEDAPSRTLRDDAGREWAVFEVREGRRWGTETGLRRADWLCCSTVGDRRYIAPVPSGWARWDEETLRAAIAESRPDHRGGRPA